MAATTRFSVAIPAYNESQLLPRLLDSIEVARSYYTGSAEAIEVVVGNNGSTDTTARIAKQRGCTVIDVEKRAIAAARNGAARAAHGDILCFIDADSILHPQTFNEIETVLAAGRCVVGASGLRMERMSIGIGLTFVMLLPATRIFRMDAGVVFCRRDDFLAVSGYREHLMVAEDVDFMWRLKRLGRKRGDRFVRLPTARATTSTRKFDRHGDWHYLPMMARLLFKACWSRGALRDQLWRYWYDGR